MKRWWIYLAAIVPVHVIAQLADAPLAQIGIQYIVNSAEAMIGAAALIRFEAEPRRLGQLSAMTNLVLIGGIAAPLVTSVAMAMAFVPLGLTDDFWLTVVARTSTNTFATITLVPLIIHFALRFERGWPAPNRRKVLEASLIGACLAIVSMYVFVWPGFYDERAPALLYAPLPLLIWATVRYEIAGVCASVLLVGAFATWGVLHEVGPFVVHSPVRNALTTVLFLNVICIPLLMLAAVLQERKAAFAEAARREQQLAHLSRVAHGGRDLRGRGSRDQAAAGLDARQCGGCFGAARERRDGCEERQADPGGHHRGQPPGRAGHQAHAIRCFVTARPSAGPSS